MRSGIYKKVSACINRMQPFVNREKCYRMGQRNWIYFRYGHDIIFGLPFQSIDDVAETILKTKELCRGNRLGLLYSNMPHVPG